MWVPQVTYNTPARMFSQQLVLNTVLALFAPLFNSPPTVTLDQATFTGESSGQVSKFLGIPYAQPP
jgi:acetylcholinesterase